YSEVNVLVLDLEDMAKNLKTVAIFLKGSEHDLFFRSASDDFFNPKICFPISLKICIQYSCFTTGNRSLDSLGALILKGEIRMIYSSNISFFLILPSYTQRCSKSSKAIPCVDLSNP